MITKIIMCSFEFQYLGFDLTDLIISIKPVEKGE